MSYKVKKKQLGIANLSAINQSRRRRQVFDKVMVFNSEALENEIFLCYEVFAPDEGSASRRCAKGHLRG